MSPWAIVRYPDKRNSDSSISLFRQSAGQTSAGRACPILSRRIRLDIPRIHAEKKFPCANLRDALYAF